MTTDYTRPFEHMETNTHFQQNECCKLSDTHTNTHRAQERNNNKQQTAEPNNFATNNMDSRHVMRLCVVCMRYRSSSEPFFGVIESKRELQQQQQQNVAMNLTTVPTIELNSQTTVNFKQK